MATRTKPPRSTRRAKPADAPSPGSYSESFPNSTKVYVQGPRGVRVPMREISQSDTPAAFGAEPRHAPRHPERPPRPHRTTRNRSR